MSISETSYRGLPVRSMTEEEWAALELRTAAEAAERASRPYVAPTHCECCGQELVDE